MDVRNSIEFSGLGASSGRVVGRVKLVFKLKDLEKIERGDIIVAPMTNPDMTVALGKVNAVITDAGGLSSHAAIIARELKIPAVVGTSVATKLLRDGMVVEVDGVKGKVKILSTEDVEISVNLSEIKDTYNIFGNRCPIFNIKVPRKEPFFERVLDISWDEPPDEIRVIAPRPEIVVTPLTYSLVIPALERLPYALDFSDIGPMYTYIINKLLHVAYDKITEVMERSKSILFDEKKWESYLKILYENYNLFTKAAEEFATNVRNIKDFNEVLEKYFIDFWKAHNSFFSQTFLIQAWGDDIIWPLIKNILEKYYDKEQTLKFLSQLSKLSEPIPSVEFYSDFQALVLNIPREKLKKLLSRKEEKVSIFKDIKNNTYFKKFMEKWYWVRDRDFYHGDLRDPKVLSRFVKLLYESKPIQEETQISTELVTEKMKASDKKEFDYLIKVGRILKRERDYHHFLWLKNTSIIKDFFLSYGLSLKKKGFLENEKDVFFFWIPEIYKVEKEEFGREIRNIIKTRKKAYSAEI